MPLNYDAKRSRKLLTFNASKKETLTLNGLKKCCRKLTSMGYSVAINNGIISKHMIFQTNIFVILDPTEKLEASELKTLSKYVKKGGKIFITSSEGKKESNINDFLKEFGIEFQSDSVIRMQRCSEYHHPKESFIKDGVVNEAIFNLIQNPNEIHKKLMNFFKYLYPYGCTLIYENKSAVLLSTGNVCFPFNRPTCVFYKDSKNGGKILAFGSTMAISDIYVSKEHNLKLFEIFLHMLADDEVKLNLPDVQSPDLMDYLVVPDIGTLSLNPYSCLQEDCDVLIETTSFLTEIKLFQFDYRHRPKIIAAYKELGITRENLKNIRPKFESPLPNLETAFYPPRFRGLPNPCLELMDLDEFFMSPKAKLDILRWKCCDDDLEYFIGEFSKVVHVPACYTCKSTLHYICTQIAQCRRKCI